MRLLVGLGNPGARYARNRHNIGFMAVDEIVRRHSFGAWRRRFEAECADGELGGGRLLALKPQTYMNESGRAVGQASRFFRLAPEEVTVIHDEIDLAPGKVRVKTGGGHAGHNGLRSIESHIGRDFRRVRIGVGHPGLKDRVTGHVLEDFSKADMEGWVAAVVGAVAESAPLLAADEDGSRFMSRVALLLAPPPAEDTPKGRGPAGGPA